MLHKYSRKFASWLRVIGRGYVHKRNIALKTNLTYLHPLCVLYDTANSLKVQCFMVPIKNCQVLLLSCHLQNILYDCVTRNQISFGTSLSH